MPTPLAWFRAVLPPVIVVLLAVVMHLLIAPRLEPLHAKILLDIGINIVLAVSLNIVNGMTGQFSIGHAGFMAVGGYTAAALTYYLSIRFFGDASAHGGILSQMGDLASYQGPWFAWGDLLFLSSCIAGGLAAAAAGLLVGLPSLRLRGDYLAIVTLGFGEIVRVLIEQSPAQLSVEETKDLPLHWQVTHLGGALGFSGTPFYTSHFWVTLFAGVTLVTAYRLRESTYGRAFFSIRDNTIAALAMGVPVTRYKVAAFVMAAFFAGTAGSLFAHQVGSALNPGELGFTKSFDILIMVVLGGLGSITGSTLTAILLTILPELLRDPPHIWHGALVLAVLILFIQRKQGLKAAATVLGLALAYELLRGYAIAQGADLSRYRMILYALSLILIMTLRPRGLLGAHEIWNLWRPQAAKQGQEAQA